MARKTVIHIQLMNEYECVREWLENRPLQTQTSYGIFLSKFCQFANTTPEQFQSMERKQARDLAWNYIKAFNNSPSMMSVAMASLKSFYGHKDGEILPFDCSRGGKHYFNNHRRKRLAMEHIPTPAEIYDLVDEAGTLRNRTIILILFQSGIRANALTRLTYGMVRNQLREGRVPSHLRITDKIDTKLRGYRLYFYDTFIGEAPGYYEDVEGRPFVGAAGQFLNDLLSEADLKRADVYITNILKCRPPNNREPLPEEIDECTPCLEGQIKSIHPKIIITLGNYATEFVFSKAGLQFYGITRHHGKPHEVSFLGMNFKIYPTFHPASALYHAEYKALLIEDFHKLRNITL
jgi:DNA polymerase